MLKYMKIPESVKDRQKEILKIFGLRAFSPRCINRIEEVRSGYNTEYFYNDDPSNDFYVWGASQGEIDDMIANEEDVIELFLTNKLKYTNKLGSPRSS